MYIYIYIYIYNPKGMGIWTINWVWSLRGWSSSKFDFIALLERDDVQIERDDVYIYIYISTILRGWGFGPSIGSGVSGDGRPKILISLPYWKSELLATLTGDQLIFVVDRLTG